MTSPENQFRTDLPRDLWGRPADIPRGYAREPQVADNAQRDETLLYGPHGESLVRRVPRRAGFRPPEPR